MVKDYKISENLIVRTFERNGATKTLINDLQNKTQQVFTHIATNDLDLLEEIWQNENYDDICVSHDGDTMLIELHSVCELLEIEPGFFAPDWWVDMAAH